MEESATSVWAVISDGTTTYLGYVEPDSASVDVENADGYTDAVQEEAQNVGFLRMCRVCVITDHQFPVQTPQGVAMTRQITALPYGAAMHDVHIMVRVATVVFLHDMHEDDRRRYMKLHEQAIAQATQMRAREAGITLSTQMPKS
jgi:hypothetical protein